MRVARSGLHRGVGAGSRAALSAIEAHARDIDVVNDGLVVDVCDVHAAKIIHGPVVVEAIAVPESAEIADPDVTEAVIDAAIISDMRSPIAGTPDIDTIVPGPITRRPE